MIANSNSLILMAISEVATVRLASLTQNACIIDEHGWVRCDVNYITIANIRCSWWLLLASRPDPTSYLRHALAVRDHGDETARDKRRERGQCGRVPPVTELRCGVGIEVQMMGRLT